MGAALNRGGSRQDWATPDDFLRAVENRFGRPNIDLAAGPENAVCDLYISAEDDSLSIDWGMLGLVTAWLNPPYSNIGPWVAKAAASAWSMRTLVLIPASVGSNWWRDFVHDRAYVCLLNGRLTFKGATQVYPKDCALLVYGRGWEPGYEIWSWKG